MQINYLVECSSQWHKVVAKTCTTCKVSESVNVNHMFEAGELSFLEDS